MKSLLSSLLAASIAAIFSQGAMAAQTSANTQPTANIEGSCSVLTPQVLSFGTYDPTGVNSTTDLDVQATFSVRCNNGSMGGPGSTIKISLGSGLNQNGSGCVNRRLSNGAGRLLNYYIHTLSSRNNPWGCAALGESAVTGSNYDTGAVNTVTMYGRMPLGQTALPGSYSDTIDIYLSF